MPVPPDIQWSLALKISAQNLILSAVDGGTGAGSIKAYDSGDALLATFLLQSPGGFVDPVTGALTLVFDQPYYSPSSAGVAAYGGLEDGDGVEIVRLPAVQSSDPVVGKLAFETLDFDPSVPIRMNPVLVG